MYQDERKFKENLKKLATDMCTSLKSLANAYDAMDLRSSRDVAQKLLKLIVKASHYLEGFSCAEKASQNYPQKMGNRFKRFLVTQFPKRLEDYRNDLRERRLDFREAALVDVLVKSKFLSK